MSIRRVIFVVGVVVIVDKDVNNKSNNNDNNNKSVTIITLPKRSEPQKQVAPAQTRTNNQQQITKQLANNQH